MLKIKNFRLVLAIVVAVILAVTSVAVVLYSLSTSDQSLTPSSQQNALPGQINDPKGDLIANVGSSKTPIVDVTKATIEKNGDQLKFNINVDGDISTLNEDETAQWNMIVLLENETDVLNAYEIKIEMNTTGIFGTAQNIEDENAQTCQVEYQGNVITVQAALDGTQNATHIEWNVSTVYDKTVGDNVIANICDFAPDEGLQETQLNT